METLHYFDNTLSGPTAVATLRACTCWPGYLPDCVLPDGISKVPIFPELARLIHWKNNDYLLLSESGPTSIVVSGTEILIAIWQSLVKPEQVPGIAEIYELVKEGVSMQPTLHGYFEAESDDWMIWAAAEGYLPLNRLELNAAYGRYQFNVCLKQTERIGEAVIAQLVRSR